jgi:hypothetical protein
MIESICDQEDIVTANIRSVKLSSPDVSSHSHCNSILQGIADNSTKDGTQTKQWQITGAESEINRKCIKR